MAEMGGVAGSHFDVSKTTRPNAMRTWLRTTVATSVGDEDNRYTAQNNPIREANKTKSIVIGRAVLSTSRALKIRL